MSLFRVSIYFGDTETVMYGCIYDCILWEWELSFQEKQSQFVIYIHENGSRSWMIAISSIMSLDQITFPNKSICNMHVNGLVSGMIVIWYITLLDQIPVPKKTTVIIFMHVNSLRSCLVTKSSIASLDEQFWSHLLGMFCRFNLFLVFVGKMIDHAKTFHTIDSAWRMLA